jgi:hypothetical protein
MGKSLRAEAPETEEILLGSIPSRRPLKKRWQKGITVLLIEEYGYRAWEWNTGLDEEKLAAYWRGIPSVMPGFFDPRRLLRGVLVEVKRRRPADAFNHEGWLAHIHQDDDSFLRGPGGPAAPEILHAGYIP